MSISLNKVLDMLEKEGSDWRIEATKVIADVPFGYLASYGAIAEETNRRSSMNISALNVGWLRKHLYEITNRDTTLPLHRIASKGDSLCRNDSERTCKESLLLRRKEGSLDNIKWWTGGAA